MTNAASQNVTNAVSFAQTQDGFLQQVGNALNQMSQLSVSAQDVTQSDERPRWTDKSEFPTLAALRRQRRQPGVQRREPVQRDGPVVTTDGDGGSFSMAAST